MTTDNVNPFNFLYPHATYQGEVKPNHLVFNANLQYFASRVGYISNLETAGKISPTEAYAQIRDLWLALEASKDSLEVDD
ncbi:MAG: hypothetical protein VKK04_11740 [Synechococcales bacterium]|nr:hypothetical protein [Synechococcales bacterium]